jgi:hypothetical protein
MAEKFSLQIHYKNKDLELPAELRVTGYTHKIAVNIGEVEVIFEPDEERNYRVVLADPLHTTTTIEAGLLKLIADELEKGLKD